MSNVLVDKTKLDYLANAISNKSGEPLTLTLDEMVSAVDGIETGGGGITPTGNIDITQAGVTDVTNYATATVTQGEMVVGSLYEFTTQSGVKKWCYTPKATVAETYDMGTAGYIADNTEVWGDTEYFNAIAKNTTVTPTESAQTIGGANMMMEGAVTVNAIPSNYVGSGITQRTSSDLSASGATVTAPSGYYTSSATKTVASGTEGTPTATKGAVNNHSIAVTPSVTNSAGYISGGTHNGTAVSVSASELVSGSQTVTENDTYDVTNLATLVVNVSGGSSTVAVGTKTATLSASASSIQFTGLSGNPTSFVVTSSANQSTGGTTVVAVAWDGTSFHGMDVTTQAEADTGFTKSYSSGTLTITATTASFQANEYKLVYSYGGSSSDIHTADVQVGSGATSITFSSLSGNPIYWSCIFKSDFSTSSGYQRVIEVANDGTNTYGHAFDSSAKAQTSWSATYSGGSLTITSSGTNNGGYFHQPGYYQLTYAVDASAPTYQTKSAYATTSAQTITADNGYDALEQVNLGALSQTNLTADNIKSGTTVTINNGNANVWSVLGTYTGGGGGTDRLVLLQTTSLGTLSTSSTSAADTGKSISCASSTNWDDYDLLIVDVSVDTKTNGRHTSTVSLVLLTGTSNVNTKNTYTVGSNKWNSKLGSTGTASTRQSTSAYGVYVNSASVSSSTLTMPLYYRYNSNSTGTLNGTYTARVYGVKLIDLIGG